MDCLKFNIGKRNPTNSTEYQIDNKKQIQLNGSHQFSGDYAISLVNLKRKKGTSITPLKLALKSIVLAFNPDSALENPVFYLCKNPIA